MKRSAGILLYRRREAGLEVLLVHPGGPFWAKRDDGTWSLPKGEYGPDEAAENAARREFGEETGGKVDGPLADLDEVTQPGGKRIHAFAAEGDFDPSGLTSNDFEMEWPPRSGRRQRFLEVDRAGWFTLAEARAKLVPGQVPFLDRLAALSP